MIFAISNEKGGQAKTTTATALAEGSARRGCRVLAIDGDPQGALSYELIGSDPDGPGVYDVMTGAATIESAAAETRQPGLKILTASHALAGLDRALTGAKRLDALGAVLRDLRSYDHVFIDCPAIVNLMQINALMSADALIIPATPDAYSIRSIQHTIAVMEDAKKEGSRIELGGILFTKVKPRQIVDQAIISGARESFPGKVYKTEIRERAAVRGLSILGASIYDQGGPAGSEYNALLDEMGIKGGHTKHGKQEHDKRAR